MCELKARAAKMALPLELRTTIEWSVNTKLLFGRFEMKRGSGSARSNVGVTCDGCCKVCAVQRRSYACGGEAEERNAAQQ